MTDFTLIVAGDPAQLTGGYVYDARIVRHLRDTGWEIDVVGLEGRFPEPDAVASHALDSALTRLPDGSRAVIDGLAMGGLPAIVERHASRLSIVALVHHPLADETGLGAPEQQRFRISETRALAAVEAVIVTSVYTARRLAAFGVSADRIAVIEPGVEIAPLADDQKTAPKSADVPPRLLCVATVTPRKGQDLLVEALAELADLPWQCQLVGALDRAGHYVARVREAIIRHRLDTRIELLGSQPEERLSVLYAQADIFVLPSHYEGYGMVITEALAHGLPVVTTTGGALAHTLPDAAGIKVAPGDAFALRDALRSMLEEPATYARYRDGARETLETLTDWRTAAAAFGHALARFGPSEEQP